MNDAKTLNRKAVPAYPMNHSMFAEVMKRAKAQFPKAQGMTKAGPDYVVMQEVGNREPLIFSVTPEEAAACGWIKL
jgi:hypothetical protein